MCGVLDNGVRYDMDVIFVLFVLVVFVVLGELIVLLFVRDFCAG